MVSLETRVIGAAVVSTVLGFVAVGLVELTVGFPGEWSNLAGFLIVAGLGIGVPQLYLASVDDSVSPTSRFGLILVLFLIVGSAASSNANTAELTGIWSVIIVTVLVIGIHQLRAGYRSTTAD